MKMKDCNIDKNQAIEIGKKLVSFNLSQRQLCDLEMILNSGFSPLEGFLNQVDYDRVLAEMRLSNGNLWPIPIALDTDAKFASELEIGQDIALRDLEGVLIAIMNVESIWQPDKSYEALKIFGTSSLENWETSYLLNNRGEFYIGGSVTEVELPTHYDYPQYRKSPQKLSEYFSQLGWNRVIAFQSDEPIYQANRLMLTRLVEQLNANLLIQITEKKSTEGNWNDNDIDKFTLVRCNEKIIKEVLKDIATLNILPLVPRQAGLRSILWNAIVHKNYGCDYFLFKKSSLLDCQPNSDSEKIEKSIERYEQEIGIKIVATNEMLYVKDKQSYSSISELEEDDIVLQFSHAEVIHRLKNGNPIPEWVCDFGIIEELRNACPPLCKQGFTVFFTGLSGSGKSTIANVLKIKLLELGGRPVTLLDGDVVRKNLSSELTFSKEHRDLNIQRIGFVANEITKNGGIAICAPIAPYAAIRNEVRKTIGANGGFVEVYVSTPITECERRDRKGLYAKARAGLIKGFTGIDDPYEVPLNPEIELDTTNKTPDECAHQLILKLEHLGYIDSKKTDFSI
jgi:sulfate adenylyltransferase